MLLYYCCVYLFHVLFDGFCVCVVWLCVYVMCVVVVVEDSLFHESLAWWFLCERVEWMFWVLCFLSEL